MRQSIDCSMNNVMHNEKEKSINKTSTANFFLEMYWLTVRSSNDTSVVKMIPIESEDYISKTMRLYMFVAVINKRFGYLERFTL